jgi:hypothetical protein
MRSRRVAQWAYQQAEISGANTWGGWGGMNPEASWGLDCSLPFIHK